MNAPLSGTAVALRHGRYEAAIASVGATLRALAADGRPLITTFDADEVRPLFRGAALAPWPNRVVDGTYAFDGVQYRLALTEPDRGHALHGLVAWLDFAVVESADDRAVLEATVPAQDGYPFRIVVTVEYLLDEDGLRTRITGRNTGAARAPYGTSGHPYLVGGAGRVDDWTLRFAAESVLQVDDRLSPTGLAPTAGTPFDFAAAHPIGDLFIDHAFTGLPLDGAGSARLEVRGADGHGAAMVWDAACPWLQVHTGDRPEPAYDRAGLAVEPMTCPPDAFNSGTDLVVLEPGESHTAEWRIQAI